MMQQTIHSTPSRLPLKFLYMRERLRGNAINMCRNQDDTITARIFLSSSMRAKPIDKSTERSPKWSHGSQKVWNYRRKLLGNYKRHAYQVHESPNSEPQGSCNLVDLLTSQFHPNAAAAATARCENDARRTNYKKRKKTTHADRDKLQYHFLAYQIDSLRIDSLQALQVTCFLMILLHDAAVAATSPTAKRAQGSWTRASKLKERSKFRPEECEAK